MSRIGKLPVKIPSNVQIKIEGNVITAKGSKGELTRTIHPNISIVIEEDNVVVKRSTEEQFDRALHGLSRSLISNMIEGVANGYKKELEIIGVGYRANLVGKNLNLSLGFSHPVVFDAPAGITFEMEKDSKNIISISGIDKELVGQVAADIRSLKKPEPYKGKGIRYRGEQVRRKAGKTAASAK